MSVIQNGGYAGTPRKVNFGWIGEAWSLFSANLGPWIVAALVVAVLPALLGGGIGAVIGFNAARTGTGMPTPSNPFSTTVLLGGGLPIGVNLSVRLFSWLWTSFFCGGVYRMAVKQVRGEPISTADIFSGGPLFPTMLLFNIVYGLATFAGTLLCVVPLFVILGLLLPAYALLADGVPLSDALSRSVNAMKQDWLAAAGFAFVFMLLITVSAVPCGLGLLATVPMFWLTSALAYRDMVGMPGGLSTSGSAGSPDFGTEQPGVWPPPPNVPPPGA